LSPSPAHLEVALAVLCLIDEAYTHLNPRGTRRYESMKRLSDSEVIALASSFEACSKRFPLRFAAAHDLVASSCSYLLPMLLCMGALYICHLAISCYYLDVPDRGKATPESCQDALRRARWW
jgi:hypothetical protein